MRIFQKIFGARLQPIRPEPPQLDREGTWVRGPFRQKLWDGERCLVWHPGRGGAPFLVPRHLVEFADFCGDSLTWEEHRQRYARRFGMDVGDMGEDFMTPDVLERYGLLVRTRVLTGDLPLQSEACGMRRVGLCVGGGGKQWSETLEAWKVHWKANGHVPPLVVMDEDCLDGGQGFFPVDWDEEVVVVGREERRRMADWLVEATGGDSEVVQWGLGAGEGKAAAGCAGTVMQILTVGSGYLWMNDPVLPVLHDLGGVYGRVLVSGHHPAWEHHLGADLEREGTWDYFHGHAQLLGRSPGSILADAVLPEFCDLDETRLEQLIRADAAVRVTVGGCWGKADWPKKDPFYWLELAGGDERRWEAAQGGFLLSCARVPTLSKVSEMAWGPLGVDGRVILPPWLPGEAHGSAFWMRSVEALRPESWFGHVPVAVGWLPEDEWKDAAPSLSGFYCSRAELIGRAMQEALMGVRDQCPMRRMERVGRLLVALASAAMEWNNWVRLALEKWLEEQGLRLACLESSVSASGAQYFLEKCQRQLEAAADDPWKALPGSGQDGEAVRQFLEDLRRDMEWWGRWLELWPVCWSAAAALSEEEKQDRFSNGRGM